MRFLFTIGYNVLLKSRIFPQDENVGVL